MVREKRATLLGPPAQFLGGQANSNQVADGPHRSRSAPQRLSGSRRTPAYVFRRRRARLQPGPCSPRSAGPPSALRAALPLATFVGADDTLERTGMASGAFSASSCASAIPAALSSAIGWMDCTSPMRRASWTPILRARNTMSRAWSRPTQRVRPGTTHRRVSYPDPSRGGQCGQPSRRRGGNDRPGATPAHLPRQ